MDGITYLTKVTLHIKPGPAIVAGHASIAVIVLCRSTRIGESICLEVRYKLQTKTRVRLTHGACSPKNVALRVCQRPPIQSLHRHCSVVPVCCRVEELTVEKRYFGERKLFVSGFLPLSETST